MIVDSENTNLLWLVENILILGLLTDQDCMTVTEQLSVEGYQQLEVQTGERYEYRGGDVRMMAGTTLEHEMIVNRLIRLLSECLEKRDCTLVTGQMKLYTPHCDTAFLYPDIHIYCGEIKKKKMAQGAYALTEPQAVVEVLSKGTRDYDRADKFDCYRQIASLQSYVMIESQLDDHDPAIYVRTWKGKHEFHEKTLELTETLNVPGCSIEGAAIYDSLFPTDSPT